MNRSLSSARVTLTRQLNEQSVRERTSENKWKTSSKSKDGKIAELEKMIETLRVEKDDHRGSRTECDEKLTEAEGALRAEAIRAERYKKNVDSARAAEHNQKMALGKCEQALERALESAGQSDADAHRFSESVAAAAAAAADDDWDEDLITDIVHPSHRYDRAPRHGTSHHLAADEAEMHGLEDDAAAAMDAEEKDSENARDPALEYPDEKDDEPEPEPPRRRKVEIEKKSKSKSPPPQKYKKPTAPPARFRNGRSLPPAGRAATASELRKNRQKARQSLFASAEM